MLCLQGQGEIANPDLLFHRQGEEGMEQTLRDTIPYFLGAVPRDQALKRAQLRDARRRLQRAEIALQGAERAAQSAEVELRSLAQEAYAAGLIERSDSENRAILVAQLEQALASTSTSSPESSDNSILTRRRELERERERLVQQLRSLDSERSLLLEQSDGELDYSRALGTQIGRLQTLGLITGEKTSISQSSGCPFCGSDMEEPDPTTDDLRDSLERLSEQLEGVEAARPAKRVALQNLDERATTARDELRAVDGAIRAINGTDAVVAPGQDLARRDFVRGRIDAILAGLRQTDERELARLRNAYSVATAAVETLERELNDDEVRDQLFSRLSVVGNDMANLARALDLEHMQVGGVRLDLSKMTVVTDTASGPAPLFRVGSAENWIGYHLVAHLALHRFLVGQNRPVPRILMIDQPTQGYYPSELSQRSGLADTDKDRAAVQRLFKLLKDVNDALAPDFQIIVCDHANLPEPWFQEAVSHNWRGERLIPSSWIDAKDAAS